jgi:hypothetical protein
VNAEQWNALYPVGTPVFAYPGFRPEDASDARRLVTRTRTAAQVSASGHAVVWVEGEGSYICLTHVDPVSEEQFAEARAEETAAAVAALGALPVPVGDQPQPLTDEQFAEIQSLDLLAMMPDKSAAIVSRHLAALLAEVQRLKAELAREREDIAFLHRNTLPELRREVEHHKAGKQRWRDRAETAEAAVQRGLDTLRVWRDEREANPQAARLLYEVGAALTDEPTAAKPAGMHPAIRTIDPAEEA